MKPYESLMVCGCEYHLKFTTANAVKLDEDLGTDLLSGIEKLTEIKTLAKYVYYATVSLNDNINSIDDVYQLFDDFITEGGDYNKLTELIIEVLVTSGIMTKEAHEASKKAMEKQKQALQKLLE